MEEWLIFAFSSQALSLDIHLQTLASLDCQTNGRGRQDVQDGGLHKRLCSDMFKTYGSDVFVESDASVTKRQSQATLSLRNLPGE